MRGPPLVPMGRKRVQVEADYRSSHRIVREVERLIVEAVMKDRYEDARGWCRYLDPPEHVIDAERESLPRSPVARLTTPLQHTPGVTHPGRQVAQLAALPYLQQGHPGIHNDEQIHKLWGRTTRFLATHTCIPLHLHMVARQKPHTIAPPNTHRSG